MKNVQAGLDDFLNDIVPFFYRRRVSFVDVGAYKGDVFQKVLASGLNVGEAHLFEPNPVSLSYAKERPRGDFKGHSVNYYNMAVGSRSGKVRMHAGKTMTKVIQASSGNPSDPTGDDNEFDVECTTLDVEIKRITEHHISLLKIDVEGFEVEVLKGATNLLSEQRADCIYIEAGMNPNGVQQCYYRDIEDVLVSHGYGLFKIYEQHNEWMVDSPLLRRVNLAFMSRRFADSNPYRLTRELFDYGVQVGQLKKDIESINLEKSGLQAERQRLLAETAAYAARAQTWESRARDFETEKVKWQSERAAAEVLRGRIAQLESLRKKQASNLITLESEVQQLRSELGAQAAKLRISTSEYQVLNTRSISMIRAKDEIASVAAEAFDSLRDLHWREMNAIKAAAKAQQKLAAFRARPAFRLAKVAQSHARSLKGWATLPFALLRELSDIRRGGEIEASVPEVVRSSPVRSFDNRKSKLSIPLTVRPQRVALSIGVATTKISARVLLSGSSGSVNIQLGVSDDAGLKCLVSVGDKPPVMENIDVSGRLRKRVRIGAQNSPLLEVVGPTSGLEIELSRADGQFCILVLELDAPLNLMGGPVAPALPSQVPQSTNTKLAPAGLAVPPPKTEYSALDLEKKLWGGYAEYALPALSKISADSQAPNSEREAAAWHLARWYYAHEDYAEALRFINEMAQFEGKPQNRLALAQLQCLIALGRLDAASRLVEQGLKGTKKLDFKLLASTVIRLQAIDDGQPESEVSKLQLECLNEVLAAGNLAPLRKRDPGSPLTLANLTAAVESAMSTQYPKVSIIIPTYNAASSIRWVLGSLLDQTWKAIEIVVVDDFSIDKTTDIVRELAARDPRIVLIKNAENLGAYRARNAGVRSATGDLITVHDSDDWSHPQKIERQVKALLERPDAVAVVSHWIRVGENLEVVGPWLPKGTLYDVNFSSLMLRKSVTETIGLWDEVRVSGDAEYYFRLQSVFGEDCVIKLPQTNLLALSLTRADSLTRSKATHISTLLYGLRWNYRDSFRYWHARLQRDDTLLNSSPGKMNFPVPIGNGVHKNSVYKYDLVIVADFAMRGGAFVSTLNYMIAAAKSGRKVATFHWRKYSLSAAASLQPRFYDACLEHKIDILSPGDNVVSDVVLFGYPAILAHQISPLPTIATKHLLIIVNQFASRLVGGQDVQYDPVEVRKRLKSIFGMEGIWIPISAWVARLMRGDSRYPSPSKIIWNPMIDVAEWCANAPRWRGAERRQPVVGRHGRDAYTKWPSTVLALSQAYGVKQEWDVRFLGGANHAISMLGGKPSNWTIVPFDGMTAQEFLLDLDFYIHYPHEEYIEEFGRAVMEAMALGIPAILPPQFLETFGDAAVYAESAQVPTVISTLWASKERYLEQAKLGQEFVKTNCDLRSFDDRLRRTLEASRDRVTSRVGVGPHAGEVAEAKLVPVVDRT